MRILILLFAFFVTNPNLQAADEISEQLLSLSLSNALVSTDSEEWQTASAKLDELYHQYEQCLLSKVMDVHKFNSAMKWNEVLPVLMKIDTELFGSDASTSYENVEKNIKNSKQYQTLIEQDKKNFDQEFLHLKNHLSRGVIESHETHVDMQKLLSRIWSLSDNFGFLSENYMINDRESAIDFMITSIRTNIFEGGGCYPGYAGRLALNYLMILHSKVCCLDSLVL